MKQKLLASIALLGLVTAPSVVRAGQTFTDSTFNLANYTQAFYVSDPTATVNVSQALTGGNPGSALQVLANVPAGNGFSAAEAFANNSFVYDPSAHGALLSVDAAGDKYLHNNVTLYTNGFRPLILQGGNYYYALLTVPAIKDTWLSATQSGLAASDFSLFDFTTGITDTTQHPDFTGGVMQFGLLNRFTQNSTMSSPWDIRYDNLTIGIHAVPEASSAVAFAGMLVGGAGIFLRKRARGFAP